MDLELEIYDEFFEWVDKNVKIDIPISHDTRDYETPISKLDDGLLDRIFEPWLQMTYGRKFYEKWKKNNTYYTEVGGLNEN